MASLGPNDRTRNPFAESIAQVAIETLKTIAASPEAVAAIREILCPSQAPELVSDAGLRSKKQTATALGVSVSTVDRLTREGMPVAAHVGDCRRYDLGACQTWLANRGKRPTKAPTNGTRIDVSDVAEAARLVSR
jgi:hypothetical protein